MTIPIEIEVSKLGFSFIMDYEDRWNLHTYTGSVVWHPTTDELKELRDRIEEAIDECS